MSQFQQPPEAFSPGYGPGEPKTIAYQASPAFDQQFHSGTADEKRARLADPLTPDDVKRADAAGLSDLEFGYDAGETQTALNARRAAFVWPVPSDTALTPPLTPNQMVRAEDVPQIDQAFTVAAGPETDVVTHVAVPRDLVLEFSELLGLPENVHISSRVKDFWHQHFGRHAA